jgi:hypothetical protein
MINKNNLPGHDVSKPLMAMILLLPLAGVVCSIAIPQAFAFQDPAIRQSEASTGLYQELRGLDPWNNLPFLFAQTKFTRVLVAESVNKSQ